MKKLVYIFFILFCIKANTVLSQDKLFLRNGSSLNCKIVSINEHTISYRDTVENSPITTVAKTQIILAEIKGEVFIFGSDKQVNEQSSLNTNETWQQRQDRKMQDWKKREDTLSNNILGFYLPVILLGRLGVSYERLFANKSIGIKIPFILTYNTFAYLPSTNSSNSGTTTTVAPNKGVGFITGIDVNFYHDIKPQMKYYFGPRIRYGTDMLFGGVEGLTAQIQNGIFRSSGKRFTNTFGVGVGFIKFSKLSSNTSSYNEKQVYPSVSLTWRLGFRL
jgi:hypothetical protein